jgi:uncharacterized protein (DUF1778 family)
MEFFDEYINIRLKPSQKEVLKHKANKENLSVSAYCRVKLANELTN